MRVGLLSDVHANRVALSAVLEDMPPVDELVCAGDLVGYNPWPADVVEAIRERDVTTVQGNHDRTLASGQNFRGNAMAHAGIDHARDQLSAAQIEFLGDLSTEQRLFDGRLKVVHGHPEDPDRYTYPEDVGPHLLGEETVLVMGHTHVQHVEHTENGFVVNPGSVGQPRDRNPKAAYAVADLDALEVTTHRVSYDIDAVKRGVAEADLPLQTAERLTEGR